MWLAELAWWVDFVLFMLFIVLIVSTHSICKHRASAPLTRVTLCFFTLMMIFGCRKKLIISAVAVATAFEIDISHNIIVVHNCWANERTICTINYCTTQVVNKRFQEFLDGECTSKRLVGVTSVTRVMKHLHWSIRYGHIESIKDNVLIALWSIAFVCATHTDGLLSSRGNCWWLWFELTAARFQTRMTRRLSAIDDGILIDGHRRWPMVDGCWRCGRLFVTYCRHISPMIARSHLRLYIAL